MNMVSKCSSGFLLKETMWLIKKTVLHLNEELLNPVIFDKKTQLYLVLQNESD